MAARKIGRESRMSLIVGVVAACLIFLVLAAGGALAGPVTSVEGGPLIKLPSILIGHVTWQGRPSQPNGRQQLGVSLVLKLGTSELNFPVESTDESGFFTVTINGFTKGNYLWRVKDAKYLDKHSTYLANSGTVKLTGDPITRVEMGLMLGGDVNGDNIVNMLDFQMVRRSFGPCPQAGCPDTRVDLNGDNVVSISDFSLLKQNFDIAGAGQAGR